MPTLAIVRLIPLFGALTALPAQTVLFSMPLAANQYAGLFGDLDGDGTRDLGVITATTLVLRAIPSGAVLQQFATPTYQIVIPCGDVDGDGRDDIALPVASVTGTMITVLAGGTWATLHTFLMSGWGHLQFGVLGDLTGDLRPEFLVGDYTATVGGIVGAGRIDVINGVTGAIVRSDLGTAAGQGLGWVFPLGDLDGDGRRDYATRDNLLGHVTRSGVTGQVLFATPAQANQVLFDVGDIDADGHDDFAWPTIYGKGSSGDGGTIRSGANGAVLYTYWQTYGTTTGDRYAAPAGDFDGDGFADLLMAGGAAGLQTRILSMRTLTAVLQYSHPGPGTIYAIAGDVDADSFPDLFVKQGNAIQIHSGRPAGVTPIGTGCPDASNVVPRLGIANPPRLAQLMWVNLADADPNRAAAVLALGYSDQQWSGLPLPFDLGWLGLPGCTWYIAGDSMPLVATAGPPGGRRHASHAITIPNDPLLIGATAYGQWIVFDTNPTALSGAVTRAVRLQVVP